MVGINNSDHNYWSNQFLGGLAAPQGNLGGDGAGNFTGEGAIDFTTFAGNQYFVACAGTPPPPVASIPVPATTPAGLAAIALLCAAGAALALRRDSSAR